MDGLFDNHLCCGRLSDKLWKLLFLAHKQDQEAKKEKAQLKGKKKNCITHYISFFGGFDGHINCAEYFFSQTVARLQY